MISIIELQYCQIKWQSTRRRTTFAANQQDHPIQFQTKSISFKHTPLKISVNQLKLFRFKLFAQRRIRVFV